MIFSELSAKLRQTVWMLMNEGIFTEIMKNLTIMSRIKLGKAHMSKIMNDENELVQIADVDTVDERIESADRKDNGGVLTLEEWKGLWDI